MAYSEQFGAPSEGLVRVGGVRIARRGRGREELFLIAVLAIGGLVDWFHLIKLGEVSLQAVLTIVYAFLSWFLWFAQDRSRRHVAPGVRPFLVFLAWIALSFVWFRPTIMGTQNFLVWVSFAGILLVSENTLSKAREFPHWMARTLMVATIVACVLYVIFMLLDGLGSNLVFHSRIFATYVLIGMSWLLAGWRYGSKRDLFWALLLVFLIILSLSRMALATAVLLFPLAWVGGLRRREWLRLAFAGILISAIVYAAVLNFEPLRNRFTLDADTSSITEEEAADYTSGRFTYWVVTLASGLESPWIGHGAGTSASLISSLYPVDSPLDEYLRIFHDYGLVGLVLFLYAVWKLLWASWQKWVEAKRYGAPQARIHLAAFLAVVGVFFPMLTENSFIYLLMMAPLGVFLGASLGLRRMADA
jgi:O-antigen ligase